MRPVVIFGVHYESVKSLQCDYPYLSAATLAKRIRLGYSDEEVVKPPLKGPIPLTIRAAHYESVAEAARDTTVPYTTYLYRVRKAMNGETVRLCRKYTLRNPEKDATYWLNKEIIIDGVQYPSYMAASVALGINYQTLISRIKNGWYDNPGGKEVRPPKSPHKKAWGKVVTYNGVTYPSRREFARAFGVDPERFVSILARGVDIDAALTALSHDRAIVYEGVSYPNKTALAQAYGANVRRFLYRMGLGYSIEDALSVTSCAELREKYKAMRDKDRLLDLEPEPSPKPACVVRCSLPGAYDIRVELEDIEF